MAWVLCPRDGLSIKDARGFNLAGGLLARGLPWPLPETVGGAVRAAVGLAAGYATEPPGADQRWSALRTEVRVTGLMPCWRRPGDEEARWAPLWPAPADAVHERKASNASDLRAYPLRPGSLPPGVLVRGLWRGGEPEILATEGLLWPASDDPAKPVEAPLFWPDSAWRGWLLGNESVVVPAGTGPKPRVDAHTKVDRETGAAEESLLFAHDTYELLLSSDAELALAVRTEGVAGLAGRLLRLGGESRLARVEAADDGLFDYPTPLDRLRDSPNFRLVLVTPARFQAGWRPDWLRPEARGDRWVFAGTPPALARRLILRAAIVPRAIPASGWDLAAGGPKASRRLVPAGSVYYFQTEDEQPLAAAERKQLWMKSLQVEADPCALDGYGLAVPGRWER